MDGCVLTYYYYYNSDRERKRTGNASVAGKRTTTGREHCRDNIRNAKRIKRRMGQDHRQRTLCTNVNILNGLVARPVLGYRLHGNMLPQSRGYSVSVSDASMTIKISATVCYDRVCTTLPYVHVPGPNRIVD